ncbi:copper resistance protein B [Phenylobacterium sp.]|uniref:copper resistance protein B n=1 Tax=Phenylobacterium sp. TaxID=1871053 RepID=UPI0035B32E29
MKRLLMIAAAPLAIAAPAFAQDPHAHHHAPAPAAAQPPADPHAGHAMPAAPADPHAGHAMSAAPADPHAGHAMPAAPADPHAGHAMPAAPADPHAGHAMPAAPAGPHAGHGPAQADPHAGHNMAPVAVGSEPAPPAPTDHAAERFFPTGEMAAARAQLRHEHGDIRWSKVMAETFELRPSDDGDVVAWEGAASYGGDINRFTLKTEGELEDGDLHEAEVQALYSRAIGPYFNLNAGVRQDFEPRPRRTYATVGVDGVAPYWFEVEGALFLSDEGDLSARVEGSYDFRLTQRLILEPRAEANLAASADRALGEGSGLRDLELGLRLRYAVQPTFAPYVGVNWERKFGDTADFARAAGEPVEDTRFVVGVRAWF